MPTIEDIARLAGVSKTTVSLALSDHPRISAKTKEKIRRIAENIHYVPNRLASALSQSRSRTIGVVFAADNIHFDDLFAFILAYISEEALKSDYTVVLIAAPQKDRDHKDDLDAKIARSGVEGAIVLSWSPQLSGIKKLAERQFPLVILGQRRVEGVNPSLMSFVANDSFNGTREGVEYLWSKGHRRIAFAVPPKSSPWIEERIRGYKSAMEDLIPGAGADVIELPASFHPGDPFWAELKNQPFTAYFAASRQQGRLLLQFMRWAEIDIPKQVSLLVTDDFPEAVNEKPPITVIKQESKLLGQMSCRMLLELLTDPDTPRRVFVPPTLVIRGSVASPAE